MTVENRIWEIPEGVRVRPDGSWQVGDYPVLHAPTLRYLKAHLQDGSEGPHVVDGAQRLPVKVEGPPFEVVVLVLAPAEGRAVAALDDGTEEEIQDASLSMNHETGRFEC